MRRDGLRRKTQKVNVLLVVRSFSYVVTLYS